MATTPTTPETRKRSPLYKSAEIRALDVIRQVQDGEAVSKQARGSAQRIAGLSSRVTMALTEQQAPYRVVRWVAWAKGEAEQHRRAELALHLRRALGGARQGWPDCGRLKAALDVLDQAGGAPASVPVERYAAALQAVPSRRRRAVAPMASPVTEDDVLRALELRAGKTSRRPTPPTIKLRTTPLRLPSAPDAARATGAEQEALRKENKELRRQIASAEIDTEIVLGDLRRQLAGERAASAHLRELLASASKHPSWLALGTAAVGGAVLSAGLVKIHERTRGQGEPGHVEGEHAGGVEPPRIEPTPAAMSTAHATDDESLLRSLLPVVDNLLRAQEHADEGAPTAAIAEGLRIVSVQLDEALVKRGWRRVPALGQVFDPAKHEAVAHVAAPVPAGTVVREVASGYMEGDRLVRAAVVVVSKGRG